MRPRPKQQQQQDDDYSDIGSVLDPKIDKMNEKPLYDIMLYYDLEKWKAEEDGRGQKSQETMEWSSPVANPQRGQLSEWTQFKHRCSTIM